MSGFHRFHDGKNPAINHAAKELRALLEKEGGNWFSVLNAFAEVMTDQWEEYYSREKGLRRSTGHACIRRLLGKSCSTRERHGIDCGSIPGGWDHPALWLKNGKPYSITFEPYSLSLPGLLENAEFCAKHNLFMEVTSFSMYYPGRTLLVEIKRNKLAEEECEAVIDAMLED